MHVKQPVTLWCGVDPSHELVPQIILIELSTKPIKCFSSGGVGAASTINQHYFSRYLSLLIQGSI